MSDKPDQMYSAEDVKKLLRRKEEITRIRVLGEQEQRLGMAEASVRQSRQMSGLPENLVAGYGDIFKLDQRHKLHHGESTMLIIDGWDAALFRIHNIHTFLHQPRQWPRWLLPALVLSVLFGIVLALNPQYVGGIGFALQQPNNQAAIGVLFGIVLLGWFFARRRRRQIQQ